MSTIANLDVNLFARTKKFDDPLKKSGKSFSLFSAGIDKGIAMIPSPAAVAAVAIAGVTAAAATAAAGVAALASRINSLNTEVRDFERFGLSAEKSFGQFKVLASDAGLELEDFADLAKDLGVRIGEANLDGEGEVSNIFSRLGLDVKRLAGLAPEKQLEAYAGAISKVENETERLALTDILLSDAGTKALSVLEKGTAGFAEAASRAESFGLNVSAVDTAQLESAQQSMSQISLLAEGLFNTIATEGAPSLQAMADLIAEGAGEMGGFSSVTESAFSILNAGIGFAIDGWNVMIGSVKLFESQFFSSLGSIYQGLGRLEATMVKFGGKQFDLGISDISDNILEAAAQLAVDGAVQVSSGLNGEGSKGFSDSVNAIKKQAEDRAKQEEQAKQVKPPEIKPIDPPKLDFSKIGNALRKAWGKATRDANAALEKERPARPSVSALGFGSADTQSFLNQLGQADTDKEIDKQLAESRKHEKEQFDRNIKAIKDLGVAIGRTTGVIVPLG